MAASTAPNEQELLDVERRFWNAIKDKDAATAIELTDERCVVVGAQGVSAIDARTMGKLTTEGEWKLEQYSFDEQARHTLFLTPDIAIVACPVHERVIAEGQSLSITANDSSVWIRRDGQWRCALHTESLAGDPFGRDKTARSSN